MMDRQRPDRAWITDMASKTLAGRFRRAPAQKAVGPQREYDHLAYRWLAAKIAIFIMIVVYLVDWLFF